MKNKNIKNYIGTPALQLTKIQRQEMAKDIICLLNLHQDTETHFEGFIDHYLSFEQKIGKEETGLNIIMNVASVARDIQRDLIREEKIRVEDQPSLSYKYLKTRSYVNVPALDLTNRHKQEIAEDAVNIRKLHQNMEVFLMEYLDVYLASNPKLKEKDTGVHVLLGVVLIAEDLQKELKVEQSFRINFNFKDEN